MANFIRCGVYITLMPNEGLSFFQGKSLGRRGLELKKGKISWASLAAPIGSEPGFRRPAVIVSANEFNDSKIEMVLAAVITLNLRLADVPDNFKIDKKQSKLAKDSVINISQIITLDKNFLKEKVSKLGIQQFNAPNEGLKLCWW